MAEDVSYGELLGNGNGRAIRWQEPQTDTDNKLKHMRVGENVSTEPAGICLVNVSVRN